MTKRIAVCVEYCGQNYHGWQQQHHANSVQAELENAVSRVADESVKVVAAGRTDTGVHATAQIAHFDTSATRSAHEWLRGVNTYLPDDIVLIWATEVDMAFHARFKAAERSYRYVIHNRRVRPGYLHGLVTWHRPELDVLRMQSGADGLTGTHDFSAFRAAGCQNRNPVKTIHKLSLQRSGEWISLDITANGFLQHMVRNIAGVLIKIGEGRATPEWAAEVLRTQDRTQGGVTAPPDGLYFSGATYPPEFELPPTPPACCFW